ncbi:hypothetical protein [Lysinibacillus sp. NPDC047702]|uniref:hypothetical protein n=1 Tax=unclassified Lysinibacillus TaxID=2636778 RepID=UPI003D02604D
MFRHPLKRNQNRIHLTTCRGGSRLLNEDKSTDTTEDILSKTVSLEQAKTIHMVYNATREDNRLENEVNLDADASRGIFIDRKYDKLSDLELRIQNIQERITEKLEDNKLDDKLIMDISDKSKEDSEGEIEK